MDYRYCCVNPESLSELEEIIENGENIEIEEFLLAIGEKNYNEIAESLGYIEGEFDMRNDPYIGYYKSYTNSISTIYYLTHSAIEYIYY